MWNPDDDGSANLLSRIAVAHWEATLGPSGTTSSYYSQESSKVVFWTWYTCSLITVGGFKEYYRCTGAVDVSSDAFQALGEHEAADACLGSRVLFGALKIPEDPLERMEIVENSWSRYEEKLYENEAVLKSLSLRLPCVILRYLR